MSIRNDMPSADELAENRSELVRGFITDGYSREEAEAICDFNLALTKLVHAYKDKMDHQMIHDSLRACAYSCAR